MAPDLLLSVTHPLTFASVSPFLEVLRKTGSATRVHFSVDGVSRADCARIETQVWQRINHP
jgi:hypothetical protein